MKKIIAIAVCATLGTAAQSATLDFLEFANDNEHGVANGTTIEFEGVDVTFNAGLHEGIDGTAFAYFDHGGAGLGVCKSPRSGVTFGEGRTGAGRGNDCSDAGDDNVTVTETVTISFDQAFNLSELSFTGEGHSFSNPVFLEDETTGLNRSAATLLFGVNGGPLAEFTFSELSMETFLGVTSATFAFDDANFNGGNNTADQFYLASAVVNPVPLPAGLPLLLAGIGGLGILRRRQRNKS
ncbi:VPLPA-CTERM sorting domain-containing protein [Roseobacter sp. S98]|uniref:VPLPA-CTERM sorting domain-containing protein n=1 Tax=Roseobacter algicola (ex Choi et al. 2025) (nom. illeg.) TaxID=3092138 RepID=UPI0035C67BFC